MKRLVPAATLLAAALPLLATGTGPARAATLLSSDPVAVSTTFRPNPEDAARAIAVHADGSTVLAGDAGGDFGLFRSTSSAYNHWGVDGQVTVDFDGRADAALAVATAEDDATVAAGTSSGDVAVVYVDREGLPSAVFGLAGRVRTDLGGSDDAAYGVVPLPGGGVVVAGGNATSAAVLKYRPDGSLDPSFGSGGKATRPSAGPWRALAVQPDGKLVVAGGGDGLVVARYTPDGAPDTGFGTGGVAQQLAGTGAVAHALSLWVDGSVSVAGGRNGDVAMARWDGLGAPLVDFGGTGALVVDLGGDETAYGLAVNYEGTMNVVGERGEAGFALSYLPDGRPNPEMPPDGVLLTEGWKFENVGKLRAIVRRVDYGFAVAGTTVGDMMATTFSIANGRGWFWPGGRIDFASVQEEAFRAVRQADGKVVIVGVTSGMVGLVRHNPDGTLDRSYGVDGRAVSTMATWVKAAAVDSAGRTLVTGAYRNRLSLLRFGADGRQDMAFGIGGRATPAGTDATWDPQSVIALPDGKVLVVGAEHRPDGIGGWVARFTPEGLPDLSFGTSGIRTRVFPGAPTYLAGRSIRQPDGKILVVGPGNLVTRLLPDGARDPGFGTGGTVVLDEGLLLEGATLLPDGRVVVATSDWTAWPHHSAFRLSPSGQVDPAFDARLSPEGENSARTLIPLADGRLLAEHDGETFRLLASGALDRTYGNAGRLVTGDGDKLDKSVDAFLDPDGRLLTAGSDTYQGFALVRSRTGPAARPAPAAWGWNPLGQLGTGSTADRFAPTDVPGLADVVSVAGGTYHSLALRSDGSVWAWGWNGLGQLGDGTTVDRRSPVRVVGLDDAVAVSAGAGHSLAIRADGTVWSWGWNALGQLGDGTTVDRHTPVKLSFVGGVREVAAGALHSLALAGSGSVYAWGWNGVGQLGDGTTVDRHVPTYVPTSPPAWWYPLPIVAISAGSYHSVAVNDYSGVQAWGWNAYGQLGDGTTVDRHAPVAIDMGGASARDVAAGALHTLAVLGNGTAKAWGWNGAGQVGDGTVTDRNVPVPVVGLTDVRSLAAGSYHSLAVGMDGVVRAWGWNGVGQLGTGGTADRWAPTVVPGPRTAVVAAGGFHSLSA